MKVTRVKLKFVDSSRRIYDPPATEGLAWLSVYPTIKRSQRRLSGKINCSCSKEQILNRNFYSPRKAENFLINNNFGRLCFSRLIIKIHCIAIISREGLPKMSDWDKGSSLGQLQFKTWRKPIHMTYRIHQLISAHPTPTLLPSPSPSPSPSHLNLNKLYLLLGRLTLIGHWTFGHIWKNAMIYLSKAQFPMLKATFIELAISLRGIAKNSPKAKPFLAPLKDQHLTYFKMAGSASSFSLVPRAFSV